MFWRVRRALSKEGIVVDLLFSGDQVQGVVLIDGTKIYSKAVIIATGTYLASEIYIGEIVTPLLLKLSIVRSIFRRILLNVLIYEGSKLEHRHG